MFGVLIEMCCDGFQFFGKSTVATWRFKLHYFLAKNESFHNSIHVKSSKIDFYPTDPKLFNFKYYNADSS